MDQRLIVLTFKLDRNNEGFNNRHRFDTDLPIVIHLVNGFPKRDHTEFKISLSVMGGVDGPIVAVLQYKPIQS